MSVFRRILSYLEPRRAVLAAAVAATALYALLDAAVFVLLIPFVETLFVETPSASGAGSDSAMTRLLDATVHRWMDAGGDPLAAVERIIALILLAFLLKNAFQFARVYLLARAEQGLNKDLRDAVYGHLVELDLAFFGRTRAGQIVSRLTTEIEQLRMLVTAELSRLLSALFEFAVALIAMLLISWRLTLAAFVVVPLAMAVWGPLVGVLRRRDRRALHLGGEVHAHVTETVAGMRLVKAASAEGLERARFGRLTRDYFDHVMRAERARALALPMTEMLAAAGTAVLLWFGARLVVAGELSGPQFVGFLALSLKLYSPVKNVAKFPATAQPGLVAAERLFEFLDTPARVTDPAHPVPLRAFEREIAFEGVSFAYRDGEADAHGLRDAVLRDVSFTVPKGALVALVGPSGAGKSTIADLLVRFFDVSRGRVSIDGVDVRDVRLADLLSLVAIVSQDTVLLHDTVAANIAYGMPGASAAEIEAAARAAHAHAFVSELPHGYDTVVGERGVELSGGQRQRIAIARALLRDAPILVLDEATSSLDAESERVIRDAIEKLLEGRTVLVIAHRLSTVHRADEILVVERGTITERGTHAELLAHGGTYRNLHDLQLTEAVEDVPSGAP
ncbi:MAG: ABC transporter ATP-binding protein [Gemmatimonadales bacterium]